MQVTLFASINQGISNIHYSANRLNYIIDINLQIAKMMIVTADTNAKQKNPGLPLTSYPLFKNSSEIANLFQGATVELKQAATNLKDAQTDLNLKTSGLSQSSLSQINPNNVALNYMPVAGMPLGYVYTIWQAIMEIVVSSFRIATMSMSQVDDNTEATVYFVSKNSLNGVLLSLDTSTSAILNETNSSKDSNVFIFLILLCVASVALAISTGILVPVIKNVKTNKQEVLELFMHVSRANIDEELKKCKKFLGDYQVNQETEMIIEGDNADKDGHPAEGEDAKNGDPQSKIKKGFEKGHISGRRHDKYKRLALGLGMLAFKFIFVILLMETYFVVTYFLSSTFLSRVSSLTTEMSQLISNLPSHGLFLLVVK